MRNLVLFVFLAGCAGPLPDPTDSSLDDGKADSISTVKYVDADDYWTDPADQDAWFALKRQLKQEFDAVCGDTFCEGDYSNLQAMSFKCSVSTAGAVKNCLWFFSGSYETVNPRVGTIAVHDKQFRCKVPLAGDLKTVVAGLTAPGTDAIRKPLANGQTIYDVIADCL